MTKLIRELIAFAIAIIEVLLIFRFILKMLAANANVEFVAWVYDATGPLLAPFQAIFPTSSVRGGFALEFSTLFAIFAYAFMGFVMQELLKILERHDK